MPARLPKPDHISINSNAFIDHRESFLTHMSYVIGHYRSTVTSGFWQQLC